MDSLFYNFDEECDSCELDCDSVYYVLFEAWPVVYVPCQDCPPGDTCDNPIPAVVWDACYSWYDGCIPPEELAFLVHAMQAEVKTHNF